MIDPFDKGTIDIFAEEFWHPANRPERQKEIQQKDKPVQPEEKRAAAEFTNSLDDLKHPHVKNMEGRLVLLETFIAQNKLEPAVKQFTKQHERILYANKDKKQKKT